MSAISAVRRSGSASQLRPHGRESPNVQQSADPCMQAASVLFEHLEQASGGKGRVEESVAFRVWPALTMHASTPVARTSIARLAQLRKQAAPLASDDWMALMGSLSRILGVKRFLGSVSGVMASRSYGDLRSAIGGDVAANITTTRRVPESSRIKSSDNLLISVGNVLTGGSSPSRKKSWQTLSPSLASDASMEVESMVGDVSPSDQRQPPVTLMRGQTSPSEALEHARQQLSPVVLVSASPNEECLQPPRSTNAARRKVTWASCLVEEAEEDVSDSEADDETDNQDSTSSSPCSATRRSSALEEHCDGGLASTSTESPNCNLTQRLLTNATVQMSDQCSVANHDFAHVAQFADGALARQPDSLMLASHDPLIGRASVATPSIDEGSVEAEFDSLAECLAEDGSKPLRSVRRHRSSASPTVVGANVAHGAHILSGPLLARAIAAWKSKQRQRIVAGNVLQATECLGSDQLKAREGDTCVVESVKTDGSLDVIFKFGSTPVRLPKRLVTKFQVMVVTHEVELVNQMGRATTTFFKCIITKDHCDGFFDVFSQDGQEAVHVHFSFLRSLPEQDFTDMGYNANIAPRVSSGSASLNAQIGVRMDALISSPEEACSTLPVAGFVRREIRGTAAMGSALNAARAKRQVLQDATTFAGDDEMLVPMVTNSNAAVADSAANKVGTSVCPFMAISDVGTQKIVASCSFTSQDCVYDLGCGTGRILSALLAAFPCRGVGVELNTALARSAENNLQRYAGRVKIIADDVRNVDLSEATAVSSYFLPHSFHFLKDHLSKSLRSGCVVLNHTYPIPGWRTVRPPANGVHVYIIGQHLVDE